MNRFKLTLGLLAMTQLVGGFTPAPVAWTPLVKVAAVETVSEQEPELELVSHEVSVILGDQLDPMSLVVGGVWDQLETPFVDVSELKTTEAVFVAKKGNKSVTRRVIVHVIDGTPPEITKLNTEIIDVPYGTALNVNKHFEAVDNIDGVITEYNVLKDFSSKQLGDQELEFEVVDSSGNATAATLKVNVVDVKAPVINRTKSSISVEWNEKVDVLKYFSAQDDVDGDVDVKLVKGYSVGNPGKYTVKVSATDKAGNEATATMVVNVKLQPDFEAPKITRKQNSVTVNYGQKINISNYFTVTDNIDKVVKLKVTQGYNASKAGTQTVKVSATDRYGNTSRSSIEVVVKAKVVNSSNTNASGKGAGVAALARKQVGKRYVFGSSGPSTFDCSGLVKYVYAQYGVSLAHSARSQARSGRAVSVGNMSAWQAGDILIYGYGSNVTHSAIYIGNGLSVHALNSRMPVSVLGVRKVTKPLIGVRRIF